jgi:H+-translocating NAD(P) transhydrogenase subunit alpha
MYAKNLRNFLQLLIKDGAVAIDWEDPIIAQSVVTKVE